MLGPHLVLFPWSLLFIFISNSSLSSSPAVVCNCHGRDGLPWWRGRGNDAVRVQGGTAHWVPQPAQPRLHVQVRPLCRALSAWWTQVARGAENWMQGCMVTESISDLWFWNFTKCYTDMYRMDFQMQGSACHWVNLWVDNFTKRYTYMYNAENLMWGSDGRWVNFVILLSKCYTCTIWKIWCDDLMVTESILLFC